MRTDRKSQNRESHIYLLLINLNCEAQRSLTLNNILFFAYFVMRSIIVMHFNIFCVFVIVYTYTAMFRHLKHVIIHYIEGHFEAK